MPSITKTTIVSTFRIGLVVVGGGIAALTVLHLASMPPPPPESDGFAHGMAAIFGGGVILLSLGLASVAVVLPSLLGREDPLGFGRWQRLALRGAGGVIVLGVLVAFVMGLDGVVHLLALTVLAFGIVCATLVWRGVEVVKERRTGVEGAA